MKKLLCGFLCVFSCLSKAEPFVIDEIKVVVFGHEETVLITKSDVDRLSLDGDFRNLDDVLMEKLMFQEAKKFKIEVDDNAINRYLANVQRENNLSLNDMKAMFSAAGYTYEEGRAQLGVMFAVNSLMDFKIRSRLIVLERDVQAYYDDHPIVQEASYFLKRLVIPFDFKVDRDKQYARIVQQLKAGKLIRGAKWSQEFWINKSDLAADKKFITAMKPGSISRPRAIKEGFELFGLVDAKPERLVPLEDRYQEIAEVLRKPRYEQLFADFQKELLASSSVLRF